MDGEPRMEDLPPIYQHIARMVGSENALKFAREFGGENIYFPKIDGLSSHRKRERDRRIREEFTGSNYMELARKYGISSRQIRKIVKEQEKA